MSEVTEFANFLNTFDLYKSFSVFDIFNSKIDLFCYFSNQKQPPDVQMAKVISLKMRSESSNVKAFT